MPFLQQSIGDYNFLSLTVRGGGAPRLREPQVRTASRPGLTGDDIIITRTAAQKFQMQSVDYVQHLQAAKDLLALYVALKTGLQSGATSGAEGFPPPIVKDGINYGNFAVLGVEEVVRKVQGVSAGGLVGKEPHAVKQVCIWTFQG